MLRFKDINFKDQAVDKWAGNTCVASEADDDTASLLSVKGLIHCFSKYQNPFVGFYYFCKDRYIWRRPNIDIVRFYYDPNTGIEIDWEKIYELGKVFFPDYSEKTEKTLAKNM